MEATSLKPAIKVFLIEDHNLVRAGIKSLLAQLQGVEVAGEAGNGRDALRMMKDRCARHRAHGHRHDGPERHGDDGAHHEGIPERARHRAVDVRQRFERDIASFRPLEKRLWAAAEEVSDRLKEKKLAGSTVTLKLKTADFRILTRARSLESPTQLAGKIFAASRDLLAREINGTRYRLLGVGVSALADAEDADPADLIDTGATRRAAAERAIDHVRGKFGHEAMVKGLEFDREEE